jgi:hypothetical protein
MTDLATATGKFPREIFEIFGPLSEEDLGVLLEASGDTRVNLKQFPNLLEFLVMLMLVGIRHAVPDADNDEAVELAKIMARKIPLPGFDSRWQNAKRMVDRYGMKQAVARIRTELSRTTEKQTLSTEGEE